MATESKNESFKPETVLVSTRNVPVKQVFLNQFGDDAGALAGTSMLKIKASPDNLEKIHHHFLKHEIESEIKGREITVKVDGDLDNLKSQLKSSVLEMIPEVYGKEKPVAKAKVAEAEKSNPVEAEVEEQKPAQPDAAETKPTEPAIKPRTESVDLSVDYLQMEANGKSIRISEDSRFRLKETQTQLNDKGQVSQQGSVALRYGKIDASQQREIVNQLKSGGLDVNTIEKQIAGKKTIDGLKIRGDLSDPKVLEAVRTVLPASVMATIDAQVNPANAELPKNLSVTRHSDGWSKEVSTYNLTPKELSAVVQHAESQGLKVKPLSGYEDKLIFSVDNHNSKDIELDQKNLNGFADSVNEAASKQDAPKKSGFAEGIRRHQEGNAPRRNGFVVNPVSGDLIGKGMSSLDGYSAINSARQAAGYWEEGEKGKAAAAAVASGLSLTEVVSDIAEGSSKLQKFIPKGTGKILLGSESVIEGVNESIQAVSKSMENGDSFGEVVKAGSDGLGKGGFKGGAQTVTGGFVNPSFMMDAGKEKLGDGKVSEVLDDFGSNLLSPTYIPEVIIKNGVYMAAGATDKEALVQTRDALPTNHLIQTIFDRNATEEMFKEGVKPEVNRYREGRLSKNEDGVSIPPQLMNFKKLDEIVSNQSGGKLNNLDLSRNQDFAKFGISEKGDPKAIQEMLAKEENAVNKLASEYGFKDIYIAATVSIEATEYGYRASKLQSAKEEFAEYKESLKEHVDAVKEDAKDAIAQNYGIDNPTNVQIDNYLKINTEQNANKIYGVLAAEGLAYDEARENPAANQSILTENQIHQAEIAMVKDGIDVSVTSDPSVVTELDGGFVSVTGGTSVLDRLEFADLNMATVTSSSITDIEAELSLMGITPATENIEADKQEKNELTVEDKAEEFLAKIKSGEIQNEGHDALAQHENVTFNELGVVSSASMGRA